MLNEKENTKKTAPDAEKKIGGTAGMVIGYVVIYLLLIGIIYTAFQIPATVKNIAEKGDVKNSKVVLYEGPKSLKDATDEDLVAAPEKSRDITLKHCVDTVVKVNGEDCYVYDTNVNNTHAWEATYQPVQERTPVTYFDFDGTVEISIKVPFNVNSVTVRPLSYDIKPDIDKKNNTVKFRVNKADAYTVEFNGSIQRAVHIFANEIETNVPNPDDENVLYLGPGEWTAENVNLESGQTLYLAGGAVLHAPINANFIKNVKVIGRGIIDNSNLSTWQGRSAKVPLKFDGCQNVTVKGVISLNSNAWCFQAYDCIGVNVDGLKIISARPNGDGISIQSSKSVKVENGFVRAWDDALVVKNYNASNSSTISFKNVQIWSDLAQCMEIGYETNKGQAENSTIKDVTFEDITVLHAFHKPVVSIHNADDAAVSDITYKNIVVEDASMGQGDGTFDLIDFKVVQNSGWSSTKERGTISNIKIDGLKVISGNDLIQSTIQGFDDEHKVENVSITGMSIKGHDIKTFEDGNFKIDENKTANLEIK